MTNQQQLQQQQLQNSTTLTTTGVTLQGQQQQQNIIQQQQQLLQGSAKVGAAAASGSGKGGSFLPFDFDPAANAEFLGKIPLASILQRLPGVILVAFVPFCFLGPVYTPQLFAFHFIFLHTLFSLQLIRSFNANRIAYLEAVKHSLTNWEEKYCQEMGAHSIQDTRHDLPYDNVRHIIIIPQYKEDLGTMYDTLDVLASHPMALTHYKICLAMEESEKEAPEKGKGLVEKYHHLFYDITMTLHPTGRPGEIRGKSSNVAWASREMVRQSGGPRIEDIFTIMDADTCFAADYFASLSYYYAVGSPKERGLMYFTPTTVFDRNADKVPILVRVADIQWSMGTISNFYPGSPFSPPCSAYSIPVPLAAAVGLWDCDELSIGEDFHMYIKTYFSTFGEVQMKRIYSPASCCNIEGPTYWEGIKARSTQSVRHMWASLDMGYTIRRAIYGLFAPTFDAPKDVLQRIPFQVQHASYDFGRLASNMVPFTYLLFEAHIFVGQTFIMMMMSNLIPRGDTTNAWWTLIAGDAEVHPYVRLALWLGPIMTQVSGVFFAGAIIYYERYQHWCGVARWDETTPNVQVLGKRSRLESTRSRWQVLWEWAFIPVCGILFLVYPQANAHFKQLWVISLDYVVAAKPKHEIIEEEVVLPPLSTPVKNVSSSKTSPKSNLPLRPVNTTAAFREDSGFYGYEGDSDESDYHPGLWSKVSSSGNRNSIPGSPSLESVLTVTN